MKKKILVYGLSVALSFAFLAYLNTSKSDFKFLETSFLHILKQIAEENKPAPADLAIENVTLKKLSDPTDNFDYYRYQATVVLKNYGGGFKKAQAILKANGDQKRMFVKNSVEGLAMENGEILIFDRYELLFPRDYNMGMGALEIEFQDRIDEYPGNNSFEFEVFELPSRLKDIEIESIEDDGTLNLSFDTASYALNTDKLEILVNESLDVGDKKEQYKETEIKNQIYGYHLIKAEKNLLKDPDWKVIAKNPSVKVSSNLFDDNLVRYLYARVIDEKTGYAAVSDIVRLGPEKNLDRAGFAKLFVDFTGLKIKQDKELSFYEDISPDEWYAPYVQTLHNLGLTKTDSFKYYPNKSINRGEALRVVLDYFDVDLAVRGADQNFKDVSIDHPVYAYASAFYATGKGEALKGELKPDEAATKNYLKYLINEFK